MLPYELQYILTDLSDIVLEPRSRMTPYGEQDENGVDVSLIRANLLLTLTERIQQNFRAAQAVAALRRNARRIE